MKRKNPFIWTLFGFFKFDANDERWEWLASRLSADDSGRLRWRGHVIGKWVAGRVVHF